MQPTQSLDDLIVVRAEGYRPLEIATETGVPGRVRCGLIPADVVLLHVEADQPLPESFSLQYRVVEDMVDDGQGRRIGEQTARSGTVEISGRLGLLALPFDEECAVELLDVQLDGRTWSPEPKRLRWAPGRQSEISVQLVPSGEDADR